MWRFATLAVAIQLCYRTSMRKKLFTVTMSDLREEFYRGSGNGGQKKQKTSSGVRLTHEPSGAQAESEAGRSQLQNRKDALEKLGKNPKFVNWCKAQASAIEEGYRGIERKLDALMADDNIATEIGVPPRPGDIIAK